MKNTIIIAIAFLLTFTDSVAQLRLQWVRAYEMFATNQLYDVFQTADGGFAMCGSAVADTNNGNRIIDLWLVKANEGGELEMQAAFNFINRSYADVGYSIIETDAGDFAIGGASYGNGNPFSFRGLKVNSEGGLVWRNRYGGDTEGACSAVIETKNNELLFAGYLIIEGGASGYAVLVNDQGDVIWERAYSPNTISRIYAVRERADGGFYFTGLAVGGQGDLYGYSPALVKIFGQGEVEWGNTYGPGRSVALVTTDGGYAMGGFVSLRNDNNQPTSELFIIEVTSGGDRLWDNRYRIPEAGELLSARGLAYIRDSGFCLVGYGQRNGTVGFALRTDVSGNLMWRSIARNFGVAAFFESVITIEDGATVVTGSGIRIGIDQTGKGLLLKLPPERLAPEILSKEPRETILETLLGETIQFTVHAFDYQNDTLYFRWTLDHENLRSPDSTVSIRFDSLGTDELFCYVTDQTYTDSTYWHIFVRDLFVYSHTPDTLELTLRRGTTQEFTLDSIAVTEGMPVSYAWTLTDIDNFDRFDLGEGSSVSVEFLRSRNYSVEGLAFRGEAQDNVIWTVRVRSAILDFSPGELSLSVLPDSLVNFEVIPFNPESDSLRFRWELDGDSVGAEAALGLRFAGDGFGNPSYQVAAIVFDGGEGDTVEWNVRVTPPAAAREFRIKNLEFRMGEPAPNPFNATTTISYALDKPGRTRLSAFDLSGREVARLVEGSREAGVHSAAWEASGVPAGIYLLRLESGGRAAVRKAVVVR